MNLQVVKPPRPKVLIAGLKKYNNQFTKALQNLGCEVEWTNGDPGKFQQDCDAAVIVTSVIGHAKATAVKDWYKHRALFVAQSGFSEVKEDFEFWLNEFREESMAKPAVPAPAPKPAAYTVPATPKRFVHPTEVLEEVYRVVRECYESEMSAKDTAEFLTASDLFKASGECYEVSDVYNLRSKLGLRKSRQTDTTEAAHASPVEDHANPMELIAKVLGSKVLDEKSKLELIGKIHAGEIKSDEIVETKVLAGLGNKPQLRVSRWAIDNPKGEVAFTVDQNQAQLIERVANVIATFAARGSL